MLEVKADDRAVNPRRVRAVVVSADEASPLSAMLSKVAEPILDVSTGTPQDLARLGSAAELWVLELGGSEAGCGPDLILKAQAAAPGVPVLALAENEALGLSALTFGAQDVLLRAEASPLALERAVRRALARPRAASLPDSLLRVVLPSLDFLVVERDPTEAVKRAFAACQQLLNAPAGYVALRSEEGQASQVVLVELGSQQCSMDSRLDPMKRALYPCSSLSEAPSDEKQRSLLSRLLPAGHATLSNVLYAPLEADGLRLGMFALANKVGGFTESDRAIASAFARLTATALHRLRGREKLVRSESRARQMLDAAAGPSFLADSRGTIVVWSNKAEQALGWSAEEVLGRPLSTVALEPTGANTRPASSPYPLVGRRRDGSAVSLEATPLGGGPDADVLVTLPPLGLDLVYEIAAGNSEFGTLRRLASGGGSQVSFRPEERCYTRLRGLERPCPDCPALRPYTEPWPRVMVRKAADQPQMTEVVTASTVDPATTCVHVRLLPDTALAAIQAARVEALSQTAGLSERERSVLTYLIMGRALDDIALILGISTRTVKFHQANVLEKLGADSRADLIRLIL